MKSEKVAGEKLKKRFWDNVVFEEEKSNTKNWKVEARKTLGRYSIGTNQEKINATRYFLGRRLLIFFLFLSFL